MNTTYEFEVEEFELPDAFESDEELGRFRPRPARSFLPRSMAAPQRMAAPRPRRPRPPRPPGGRRLYLYAPESPVATEYVRWVQAMLNRGLNLQLPVDGVMNVRVRSAIRSFQMQKGLPVTGIVGPDTERMLLGAPAPSSTAPAEPPVSAEPGAGQPAAADDAQGSDAELFEGWQEAAPPGKAADLLGRGQWSEAIRQAIQGGLRDENRLTDMVFHARHPQLKGRRLRSDERSLAQEWTVIRDRLVRPALGASPGRRLPAGPGWVRSLGPLLDKHRGDIPLPFLLGWIAVESGGRIGEVTKSLDERGYFQIHPGESKTLGLDHNRLSLDPDYSVQSGIQLVIRGARRAQALGIQYGSEPSWAYAKLLHWLPLGAKVILQDMKKAGFKPVTWDQFRAYVLADRQRLAETIRNEYMKGKRLPRSWTLPPKWRPEYGIDVVDRVFARGRELAAGLANP